VGLVSTDVSEELIASIIRVTRIGELGTTSAVSYMSKNQFSRDTVLLNWTDCDFPQPLQENVGIIR
jgi:hypothetical protein